MCIISRGFSATKQNASVPLLQLNSVFDASEFTELCIEFIKLHLVQPSLRSVHAHAPVFACAAVHACACTSVSVHLCVRERARVCMCAPVRSCASARALAH